MSPAILVPIFTILILLNNLPAPDLGRPTPLEHGTLLWAKGFAQVSETKMSRSASSNLATDLINHSLKASTGSIRPWSKLPSIPLLFFIFLIGFAAALWSRPHAAAVCILMLPLLWLTRGWNDLIPYKMAVFISLAAVYKLTRRTE